MKEVDELKEEMRDLITLKVGPEELADIVSEAVKEGVPPKVGGKGKGLFSLKDVMSVDHPILAKVMDYGNLTKKVNDLLGDELSRLVDSVKGDPLTLLKTAKEFLDRIVEVVVDLTVERTLERGDDLRPTIVPGTVSRNEVENLYLYGESYTLLDKARLALNLVRSIGVGRSMAFYFEGPFQRYLKLKLAELGKKGLEAEDLNASRWELQQPFVTLVRLLIWIHDNFGDKEVVEMLKGSSGIIYFTPKEKERHNMFTFPQLNAFVSRWLEDPDRKRGLKELWNSLASLANAAYARGKGRARDDIKLIYSELEILARGLVDRGILLWEPLRGIVDQYLELCSRFDLRPSLHFVMTLEGA